MKNSGISGRNTMKNKEIAEIFRLKALRRKELARLPFEKKIEILISLQEMAQGIKSLPGRLWKI